MNLASLWKLPVVFMLENNLYGMGTEVNRSNAAGQDIFNTAASYQMQAVQIDGMDLLQVRETVIEGISRVREGNGPVFIESMAYRFHGHSMADPSNYRDNSEVEEHRTRDPIDRFKQVCIEIGLLTEQEASEIGDSVDTTIQASVQFAEESAQPKPEALFTNIYAEPDKD